jgi:plasmid stability protein
MAQMLVRNIDDALSERFKTRAKSEGKSAEQALRDLIAGYAVPSKEQILQSLDQIRATTFGKPVLDPVAMIREDRDSDHGRN